MYIVYRFLSRCSPFETLKSPVSLVVFFFFLGSIKVYWSKQVRKNPGTEHEQNVNLSFFFNNESQILLYMWMIPVSKVPAKLVSYTSGTATNIGPVGTLLHLGALLNAGSPSWPQVLSSHCLKFICIKHL